MTVMVLSSSRRHWKSQGVGEPQAQGHQAVGDHAGSVHLFLFFMAPPLEHQDRTPLSDCAQPGSPRSASPSWAAPLRAPTSLSHQELF